MANKKGPGPPRSMEYLSRWIMKDWILVGYPVSYPKIAHHLRAHEIFPDRPKAEWCVHHYSYVIFVVNIVVWKALSIKSAA